MYLQQEDIRQFKSTLRCINYLSKKKLSKSLTNKNPDEISIEDLRVELGGIDEVPDVSKELESLFKSETSVCGKLTKEERDEYERQGALPKQLKRALSKTTEVPARKQKLASRRKMIKPNEELNVYILNETNGQSVDLIKDESKLESMQYYSELALTRDEESVERAGLNGSLTRRAARLTSATSMPTRNIGATAKMIGRDFFNRITNRAGIYRVDQAASRTKQAELDESEYNSVLDHYEDEISNYEDDEGGGSSIYTQAIDPNGHEYEDIDETFYRKNRSVNEGDQETIETRTVDDTDKITNNNSLNNLDMGADRESARWANNLSEESRSVKQPLIER